MTINVYDAERRCSIGPNPVHLHSQGPYKTFTHRHIEKKFDTYRDYHLQYAQRQHYRIKLEKTDSTNPEYKPVNENQLERETPPEIIRLLTQINQADLYPQKSFREITG